MIVEMSDTDTDDSTTETEDFGTNAWLVDQMYRRFLESPDSVSDAWQEFFSDYRSPIAERTPTGRTETTTPIEPSVEVDLGSDEPTTVLRGGAAIIVQRMEESREIPTATSFRELPAKLLEVNRIILNNPKRINASKCAGETLGSVVVWNPSPYRYRGYFGKL